MVTAATTTAVAVGIQRRKVDHNMSISSSCDDRMMIWWCIFDDDVALSITDHGCTVLVQYDVCVVDVMKCKDTVEIGWLLVMWLWWCVCVCPPSIIEWNRLDAVRTNLWRSDHRAEQLDSFFPSKQRNRFYSLELKNEFLLINHLSSPWYACDWRGYLE